MKQLFIICIVLLNWSCKKEQLDDCFRSTGADTERIHLLSDFDKISLSDKYELELVQDTSKPLSVSIIAGENIIDQIDPTIKNGWLEIKNCNICNAVRSYKRVIKLKINIHNITDLHIQAATSITTPDTLFLDKLSIKSIGTGQLDLKVKIGYFELKSLSACEIKLEGFANIFTTSIEELSTCDARNMTCDDAYFDNHSARDCWVNPLIKLYATLTNKGNIFYTNEPNSVKKIVKQLDKGQLIKK